MVLDNCVGVTGASGLLGRHVIAFFLKRNFKVIATSRKRPPFSHRNLIWTKLDLNKKINFNIISKIYNNVFCLIHIGAYVPHSGKKINSKYVKNTNIDSSLVLAKWSNFKNKHFIYASGASLYKEKFKKNIEDSKLLNSSDNIYINSKILSEKKIISLKKKGLKVTILRISSIFGWGINSEKLISKTVQKAKRGKTIFIFNLNQTKINLIHAKDVAEGIYKVVSKVKYGIYNLGHNKCVNFFNLTETIIKLLKTKSKIILKVDEKFSKSLNPLDVNILKARKNLKWQPRLSLKDGIKLMLKKKCY